ncbi:MAG TPA: DUF87 domain-containing protein [Thermoanaerobaculia bacterium]
MSSPILRFGTTGAGVQVDVGRLVASRMLLQANSGGGKSRALRSLLEETHGKVQQLVIDPEGEFATLREKFDYVLAAKTGGDVQASPRTAKLLCRRLVELSASAVLDLYDLALFERREFVKVFLTELMALPRSLWRPVLVIIDEAHVFAPERGSGESQSTDAVIGLCTQGRKRGFCAVLATQRISKLHKDAAAELLNKMIGRTGLDVDVERAAKELGFDKESRARLPRLDPGQFFVYGPAISNTVTLARTGDVRTTHPEAGAAGAVAPAPPAKIKAMLAKLADLPAEAEQEARSLVELRQENTTLKAKLTRAEKQQETGGDGVDAMTRRFFEADVIGAVAPPTDERAGLPLFAASLAVHEATECSIQAAHEHADETWKQTAYAAIVCIARRQAKLTADDVWEELKGSTPTTHEPSALGPLIRVAANKRVIRKLPGELVKTRFERRHRELQVWESLIVDSPESAVA